MAIQDFLPKSRITLTYRTQINGEPEVVDLPFRVLLLGNFSNRDATRTNPQTLDERKPIVVNGTDLDSVIASLGVQVPVNAKLPLPVPPPATLPDPLPSVQATLAIGKVDSFNPDAVAAQVPTIAALLETKALLNDVLSNFSNRKAARGDLQNLLAAAANISAAKAALSATGALTVPDVATTVPWEAGDA